MKKLALLFSIALVLLISSYYITLANTPTYLGVSFLTQDEVTAKTENLTSVETGGLAIFVRFEDTSLVYDRFTAMYFITIGEDYSGNFETHGGIDLYWISSFDETQAAQAIASNEPFSLLAIYNGSYEIISLKISTLPLVSFSSVETGQVITIIDPADAQTNRYTTTSYNMTYKVRGATSSIFPKTPYKVSLIDEDANRIAESLFGLRTDDDWNFNAVYGDFTRIREASTLDLLQQMADNSETTTMHPQNGQFCELFIDEHYYGIYQVLEPMDTQQSTIDESSDYLYKAYSVNIDTFSAEEYASYVEDDLYAKAIAKSYPEDAYETHFDPLIDYLSFIYGGETDNGISLATSSLAEISTVIDIDNLIDLSIANTIFLLGDNYKKNYLIAIEEQEDGSMLVRREYFDLNYSLGDSYISANGEGDFALTTSADPEDICTDSLFDLFATAACYDEFIALYQARYAELRETTLSEENILATINDYYTSLSNSGAYDRDTARWSIPGDAAEEYAELIAYIPAHLIVTDEYVASLS
ncbi:MAG: CotH kinase family protein [Faecalibacterium sp.]